MSPISQDDLHRIFKNLDKNSKGLVSIQELHHLLEKIGVHTTLEEIEKLVGRKSLDYIDFFFFYDTLIKSKLTEQEEADSDDRRLSEDLLKAFKVYDLNNDGYISSEELQNILSRLGLWDKRNGRDCSEMIRVYDKNSDGVLDFEEFKNMMSSSDSSVDPEII